jgi:hexosaminidase
VLEPGRGWECIELDVTPVSGKQMLDLGVVGQGQVWVDALEFFPMAPRVQVETGRAGEPVLVLEPPLETVGLHYRTDGEAASVSDPVYCTPIPLERSCTLSAVTVENGRELGHVLQELVFHSALGRVPRLASDYSEKYPGQGISTLTNGILAEADLRDPGWQGYVGRDLEVALDLGRETVVHEVRARFLQDQASWIFLPRRLEVDVSQDGRRYHRVADLRTPIAPDRRGAFVHEFRASFAAGARYLRVRATTLGTCPDWHPGAGRDAWLFCDEILVDPDRP